MNNVTRDILIGYAHTPPIVNRLLRIWLAVTVTLLVTGKVSESEQKVVSGVNQQASLHNKSDTLQVQQSRRSFVHPVTFRRDAKSWRRNRLRSPNSTNYGDKK
jgi:hypothetical protein